MIVKEIAMKTTLKKTLAVILCTVIISQIFGIISVNATQDNQIQNMVSVAKQEIGYLETTYEDGSFWSKYGEWYGIPNGAWCAMFVSWCANEAGVSNNVIPKFASCSVGMDWFRSKNLLKSRDEYSPKTGDIIFLNDGTHVGIVQKFENDIVYTIEGNACDENGVNYGVRQRIYAKSSNKITYYGIPDTEISKDINGKATQQYPAYMLPDNNSEKVWEVWKDDDLKVLCEDGNYYLVMYPFLSTGRFVCAYVEKSVVSLFSSVPASQEFYNINKNARINSDSKMYHNPSDLPLMSNSGVDKKVRAVMPKDTEVTVLFETDGYYFVRNDSVSGYIDKNNVDFYVGVVTTAPAEAEKTTVTATEASEAITTIPETEPETDKPLTPSEKDINYGDIDSDGKTTVKDATFIQKHLAGILSLSVTQVIAADVSGDNNVKINDATLIQKYAAEIIIRFPVEGIEQPTTSVQQETTIEQVTTTEPVTEPTDNTEDTTIQVEISSVSLPERIEVVEGENKRVEYNCIPENATDKKLIWFSSDENIVKVDNDGQITGVSVGNATIYAVATNGVRSSCIVTVKEAYVGVQSVAIDNTNPDILYSGDTFKLNAVVEPANATNKTVSWLSSNPDVASVDSDGVVTARTAGTVTITATADNGTVNATAIIRVNQTTTYIGDGNYCLKLKGTNSYLDHQGGTANGTNVHLWSGDGNSNANQKLKLQRIDDNRYMLWSAVSTNLLIDLNRGSSYSDPIAIGKNIDLWQNNDWEAQEWLFTKTYDGYYIIRLNTLKEGAIEAGGTGDGSNIFLGTYNPNNDMQKWELVNTSIPERIAWVYNTSPIGNVHVRSGPGTNYASIGGFNEGQQITVIGELNGDFYKVRGANRHDGNTIEGYTHKDYITFVEPSTPSDNSLDAKFNELKKRYVHGQYWNGYNSSDFSHTGTTVCLGYSRKNGITCVANGTCGVGGECTCKCGKFVLNGITIGEQCHGYALKLGHEIFGGNPNAWQKQYNLNNLRAGDIIRYLNNGHTVMVTNVSGDTVTITDCNFSGPCQVRWDKKMNKSEFYNGFSYVLKHP